jgi:hypothetical protein
MPVTRFRSGNRQCRRKLGRDFFADEASLNLMSRASLAGMRRIGASFEPFCGQGEDNGQPAGRYEARSETSDWASQQRCRVVPPEFPQERARWPKIAESGALPTQLGV